MFKTNVGQGFEDILLTDSRCAAGFSVTVVQILFLRSRGKQKFMKGDLCEMWRGGGCTVKAVGVEISDESEHFKVILEVPCEWEFREPHPPF